MRPIPRTMLPHTAPLMQPTGDAYHAEVLAPLAILTRVRVEPLVMEERDSSGARLIHKALLLYDARNSRPKGIAFATGQRVLFEGTTYRVQAVEPLYDLGRLHHVEVSLVA